MRVCVLEEIELQALSCLFVTGAFTEDQFDSRVSFILVLSTEGWVCVLHFILAFFTREGTFILFLSLSLSKLNKLRNTECK